MEADNLPTGRLELYIRCSCTGSEEFWKGSLFPRYFPLHHHDQLADQSGNAGRCRERDYFLHQAGLGEAVRCKRLVRCCNTVLLFTVSVLRWCRHVLVLQRL